MKDRRIIIADDIFSNRLLLHNVLEQLGYDAKVVDNGKKLIDELRQNADYKIVFTDIEMPVMNGLEVVRTIRNDFAEPVSKIPVIALTAHNLKEFSGKLADAGFNDIISKPYSTKKFGELLDKYISYES
jgi:CheY-like chemotaxis protein